MQYQRLLNKEKRPSEEEIIKTIGEKSSLWRELHEFVRKNCNFSPELVFFTKKYGWTIRYRRSKLTFSHFFCNECGVMECLDPKCINLNMESLERNFLGLIERVEVRFDGVCETCRAN